MAEGRAAVLAVDGKVDHAMLRRQLVSEENFLTATRLARCRGLHEVRLATLEPNGHIMIEKTDGS